MRHDAPIVSRYHHTIMIRTKSLSLIAAVWLVLFIGFVGPANAQGTGGSGSIAPLSGAEAIAAKKEAERAGIARQLDGIRAQVDQIEAAFQRDDLGEQTLRDMRARLEPLSAEAQSAIEALGPERTRVRALLEELGPPPAEGATEAASVAENRTVLNEELSRIDATLSRARLITVQINQITGRIAEARRNLFAEQLTSRSNSLLNPSVWRDFLTALPGMIASFTLFVRDSVAGFLARLSWPAFLVAGGLTIAYFTVLRILRRRVWMMRANTGPEATQATRYGQALLTVLVSGILLPLGVWLFVAVVREFGVFPIRTTGLVNAIVGGVFVIALLRSLSIAYLAPRRPEARLVPFETGPCATIHRLILIGAGALAANAILAEIGTITIAPISFEAILGTATAVIIGTLLFMGLRRIAAARRDLATGEPEHGFLRWSVIRIGLWFAILIIFLAALSGYSALSDFVANQTIGVLAILATVRLILSGIQHGVGAVLAPGTPFSGKIQRELGFAASTSYQIGLFVAGLLRLLIVVLAAIFILVPWGYDVADWFGWLRQVTTGFQVGEVTISPLAVISAIGIFIIGWMAVRAVKSWLEETYLPSTNLDVGLRNSIATGLGYLGIILAALFAISYVGLDLSRLAIIAGALSVGIGFGLQSIVNNFVSGLILLAERPIKAGDWIVVGAEQGTVRKISVRATEIETFDRASVIVPNSDLISSQVKNWTHSSTLGRIILNVGVGYDSDPEQVRDILLAVARDHDDILAFPEPAVFFMDFGASSLDFSLYAYLADVGSGLRVRSDLRYEIMRRFREAEIEIPFPQQDLHIRDAAPIVEAVTPKRMEPDA